MSIPSDIRIFVNGESAESAADRRAKANWFEPEHRVHLLNLNYSTLGVFASQEAAQQEANNFMALYPGQWTKTSPLMLQWFHSGVGHVEIVAHDVQG